MSGKNSRFTSDRRPPNRSSWADKADWAAGSKVNVEIVGGELTGRDSAQTSVVHDSVIAHWDAQATFNSSDDGRSVNGIPDQLGNYDLSLGTSGKPVVRDGAINGNVAIEFNRNRVFNHGVSISGDFTIFAVIIDNRAGKSIGGDENTLYVTSNGSIPAMYMDRGSNWEMDNGRDNKLNIGNDPRGPHVITNTWSSGGTSTFRVDATEELSGNIGTVNMSGINIGNRTNEGFGSGGEFMFGEMVVTDGILSVSDRDAEEQRLADKWGISI